MSMRAAPLFAHFSPPFNNPATFKMEFYTYNLLDLKLSLIDSLLSNNVDKQSLKVFSNPAVSDNSLLTPDEAIFLLKAYPPETVCSIFPESTLIIQGLLLNIAAGKTDFIGPKKLTPELVSLSKQYLATFLSSSKGKQDPAPSPVINIPATEIRLYTEA